MGQILQSRTSHCSKHGDYKSNLRQNGRAKVWEHCPGCIKESKLAEQQEETRRRIPWLPVRREHMTIESYKVDTYDKKEKRDRIKSYIDNFDKTLKRGIGLILSGNTGTGKTHLVTAIGVALNEASYSVEYKRLYELMRDIKKTYNKAEFKTEEEIVNKLGQFDLLILDEIGIKPLSEHELALTYEIIDLRYELSKPTIMVSNLNFEDLERFLGVRTIDRMCENGGVKLEFNWESARRKP